MLVHEHTLTLYLNLCRIESVALYEYVLWFQLPAAVPRAGAVGARDGRRRVAGPGGAAVGGTGGTAGRGAQVTVRLRLLVASRQPRKSAGAMTRTCKTPAAACDVIAVYTLDQIDSGAAESSCGRWHLFVSTLLLQSMPVVPQNSGVHVCVCRFVL